MKKEVLLLLTTVLFVGYSTNFGVKAQNKSNVIHRVKIPDFIVAKSDSIIISKTGTVFFHKYISYVKDDFPSNEDYLDIFELHPHKANAEQYIPNSVLYSFHILEKPWINEPIRIRFDSTGNHLLDIYGGIPEYLSKPDSCTFGIDSVMAINIAKKVGFEKGVLPWKIAFGWNGGMGGTKKYTWCVENYIAIWKGHILEIDANSGVILHNFEWTRMP